MAGAASLATAACGIGQRTAGPTAATLGAAELTFMFSVNPQDFGHDKVVELFQKALPQVRVELVHTPQQYEQKWDSMMAAGTPAEVTQINDDFVPSHGRKGLIRALDSYVTRDKLKRSDFYDLFWSFPAADGKWFAPAVGFRPSLLYVNVDLFQKSGVALPAQDKWDVPGWTWDDFLAAARKLTADTDRDGKIDQWGASLYHDTIFESLWSWNNGGPGWWTDDAQRFGLAEPKAAEAMEWVVDLTCRHQVQPPWDELRQTNAPTLFQQGKLAMMLSATPSVPVFRQRATSVNWDVIPYPKRATRISSGGLTTYCVPTGTKLPDHGWAFLNFMLSDDAQKVYAASGGMLPPKVAQGKLYVDGGTGRPPKHAALFVEAMKLGRKSPAARLPPGARRGVPLPEAGASGDPGSHRAGQRDLEWSLTLRRRNRPRCRVVRRARRGPPQRGWRSPSAIGTCTRTTPVPAILAPAPSPSRAWRRWPSTPSSARRWHSGRTNRLPAGTVRAPTWCSAPWRGCAT